MANSTSFLSRPEGRIAYDVRGDAPLVVCVPGMGDTRGVFRFLARDLVAAGYCVAMMDLRGHGDRDATFDRYDGVAAGSDALALIDELGGGPAVVAGGSLGGGAAVWAAAERPAAVAGVVLLGAFVRQVPLKPGVKLAMRVGLRRPWGPALWPAVYAKLYPGRPPTDLKEHRAQIRAMLRRPAHWRAFVRTTHSSPALIEERLDDVRVPVLVVMGERDSDFPDPAGEAREVAERLRGELLLVPGAGHYPHAEYPEIVSPAVVDFAARVATRA